MKRSWNTIFKQHGKVFAEPHQKMGTILGLLKKQPASRILDLGCGSGRHVVFFAENGMNVTGTDSSAEGLRMTGASLKEADLDAELLLHNFIDRFPFDDNVFDAVVSVQVIHHATSNEIAATVSEIARVLKPGGILFITVPARQNQGTRFREIEPKTRVPLDGIEKGIPHHYFDQEELTKTFGMFEIREITMDHGDHYCLLGVKPGG